MKTVSRLLIGFCWLPLSCWLLQQANLAGAVEPPVVRVSLESEPTTLDWSDSRTSVDRYLISFLMRGLLRYNESGQLECDLCRKFSISPDGKLLRFDLKPEDTWSDGIKLEALHFVNSFRRLMDPANHFKAATDFDAVAGAAGESGRKWDPRKFGVRAVSKETLEIELSRPSTLFPHLLTTPASFPIRKELIKAPSDRGVALATQAVLGPYQLAAWEPGKRLVIEGNPKYTASRPVYRVDFIFGQHAAQVRKFKDGKIDILANPTTEDLLGLSFKNVQVSPFWSTREIIFNFARKDGANLHLRRALLYALDRGSLPGLMKNGERRSTGLIPPGLSGYRELPLSTADPTRAATERAALGDPAKKIELELIVQESEANRQVAQWLSGSLAKIQIQLKTRILPETKFYQELEAGLFDLALRTWVFQLATPLELLKSLQTDSSNNRGKWAHVGFDALLAKALKETKPGEMEKLIDQMTQIAEINEVAAIPLGYPSQPFLLGPRVTSFAMTPFGEPDLIKIKLRQ